MSRYIVRSLILLVGLIVLSACVSRQAPIVNYYVLLNQSQLGDQQTIADYPDVKLGIGPIKVPDSLKRTQIATRQHGNQFAFDEFNRWAGVLEKDLEVVIGENMGLLLGIGQIGHFPWLAHFRPDYRVILDIQRMDGELNKEAILEVRWSVADSSGKTQLAGTRTVLKRPVVEPGYAGLVKAESLLIAEFSTIVAKELNRIIQAEQK